MSDIRIGALCWNQYTTWPDLLEAGRRADRLGYDSLWTWDHLYPIVGRPGRADVRGVADAGRLGAGDGADPDRPDGRRQHVPRPGPDGQDGDDARPHLERPGDPRASAGPGSRPSTRRSGSSSGAASRNACAGSARRCRSCAGCSTASARRPPVRTTARQTSGNDPPPIQERLPLLIGGGGEQVTLKLVARYGDANNVGDGFENVKRKEAILLQHCETVGRDPAEIERTTGIGTVIIRDSRAEADRVHAAMFERKTGAERWKDQPVGTPEDVAERLLPFLDIGYRHLIAGFPSPHDEESMTRFATEVRPILERA